MPKTVIQIAKLDAPSVDAAGRKFGAKAYDTAGTKYTVPKALFGMLQNGGWYEVFVEDKSYQGNPYKEIQSANATQPSASPPPVTVPMARHDDRGPKSWVCSLLGQTIRAGKLDPTSFEDIVAQGILFRDSEDAIFSAPRPAEQPRANGPAPSHATGPAPGKRDDMDDEIPF